MVFDLQASHLGSLFDPLKNLFLAGRGTDCRASYIAGRRVMEDFKVLAADLDTIQRQASQQFEKSLASHQLLAFRGNPLARVVKPVFPFADILSG